MSPRDQVPSGERDPEQVRRRLACLGKWFHNFSLSGVATAPDHFLGDFPGNKWERFRHAIPARLDGMSVLGIGCNGGFYAIEMKRRGAPRVVGVDCDARYLAQARYAAGTREILENHFAGRPQREEYLIIEGGRLAGAGAYSYSEGNATGGSEEAARFGDA